MQRQYRLLCHIKFTRALLLCFCFSRYFATAIDRQVMDSFLLEAKVCLCSFCLFFHVARTVLELKIGKRNNLNEQTVSQIIFGKIFFTLSAFFQMFRGMFAQRNLCESGIFLQYLLLLTINYANRARIALGILICPEVMPMIIFQRSDFLTHVKK